MGYYLDDQYHPYAGDFVRHKLSGQVGVVDNPECMHPDEAALGSDAYRPMDHVRVSTGFGEYFYVHRRTLEEMTPEQIEMAKKTEAKLSGKFTEVG